MDDEAAVAALEALDAPETTVPETPAASAQETDPKPAEVETEAPAVTPEVSAQGTATAEGAEAPEATEDEIDWTQFLPQPTNIPAPQPDENGQVDMEQYIQHQLNSKLAEQASELRGWQQATKVLPDIAKNPQLREFVHNQRLANVATGGNGDLAEAAKSVKSIIGAATAEGKAQGTASITVQQAAALENPAPTPPPANPKQGIEDRINAGDQSAVQELLADWIDQGAI